MAKKLKLQESQVVIHPGVASPRVVRYVFLGRSMAHRGLRAKRGGLMEWARILAYITGTVDQELLLRNEYLAAENRILKFQLKGRLRLSDVDRANLAAIETRLAPKPSATARP